MSGKNTWCSSSGNAQSTWLGRGLLLAVCAPSARDCLSDIVPGVLARIRLLAFLLLVRERASASFDESLRELIYLFVCVFVSERVSLHE